MPHKRAAQTVLRVAHPRDKARHHRQKPVSALKVHRPHNHVALRLRVPEQVRRRRGEDHAIVLRHNMVDHGKMRGVVEEAYFQTETPELASVGIII